jgi:hypothetical protein
MPCVPHCHTTGPVRARDDTVVEARRAPKYIRILCCIIEMFEARWVLSRSKFGVEWETVSLLARPALPSALLSLKLLGVPHTETQAKKADFNKF